jgi:hypothetical protein
MPGDVMPGDVMPNLFRHLSPMDSSQDVCLIQQTWTGANMDKPPTREEIESLVDNLARAFRNDECGTCECSRGFLTQIELDAGEDVSDITGKLKPSGKKIQGCKGCDPCPPGAAFAEYIRTRKQ